MVRVSLTGTEEFARLRFCVIFISSETDKEGDANEITEQPTEREIMEEGIIKPIWIQTNEL